MISSAICNQWWFIYGFSSKMVKYSPCCLDSIQQKSDFRYSFKKAVFVSLLFILNH